MVPGQCGDVFRHPEWAWGGAKDGALGDAPIGIRLAKGGQSRGSAARRVCGELDLEGVQHSIPFKQQIDFGAAGCAPVRVGDAARKDRGSADKTVIELQMAGQLPEQDWTVDVTLTLSGKIKYEF
jgi:hypothetical protein